MGNAHNVDKIVFILLLLDNVYAPQDFSQLEDNVSFVTLRVDITVLIVCAILATMEQEINVTSATNLAVFALDLRPINAKLVLTYP